MVSEPSTTPVRIGILGGTFDPVHVGHLVAAIEARDELGLDTVLLTVANDPWQKSGDRPVTRAEDRLAVVAAAVEGEDRLVASRMEIDRGGPTYTVDTVEELAGSHPGAQLFLLVGEDVAAELDTWHRSDDLARQVTLVVVHRGGAAEVPDPPGWRVVRLSVPSLQISSSDVRRRLAGGRSVEFLVPPAAIRLIRSRGLYDAIG